MPELPEVETVRRGLEPALVGATIEAVEQRRSDLRFPFPEHFVTRLTGRRVTTLERRAKYLWARLDDGTVLVMHLGMSGSFRIETKQGAAAPGLFHYPRGAPGPHDHVAMTLSNGARIVYNDPRRFGFMLLVAADALATHPLFAALGIEPLGDDLDGALLARLFAGRATVLKAALLDQKLIAGLGNIYVCEALHRAGLSPRRAVGTLARRDGGPTMRAVKLASAIKEVLLEAVAAGIGNPVVYVGAKTGRDGIHGATMASAEFAADSEEKRPTVQVGDPFVEKLLIEAGLTSSGVEMAGKGGVGILLDLDAVPQREPGMTAYEMMLSESQERMLIVLRPDREDTARAIFDKWELDFAVVGRITETGRIQVRHQGRLEADIPLAPLADQAPLYRRPTAETPKPPPLGPVPDPVGLAPALLKLMACPDLCSRAGSGTSTTAPSAAKPSAAPARPTPPWSASKATPAPSPSPPTAPPATAPPTRKRAASRPSPKPGAT